MDGITISLHTHSLGNERTRASPPPPQGADPGFRRGGGGSYRNFRSGSKLLQGPGQINKQKKLQTAVGGVSDDPKKNPGSAHAPPRTHTHTHLRTHPTPTRAHTHASPPHLHAPHTPAHIGLHQWRTKGGGAGRKPWRGRRPSL